MVMMYNGRKTKSLRVQNGEMPYTGQNSWSMKRQRAIFRVAKSLFLLFQYPIWVKIHTYLGNYSNGYLIVDIREQAFSNFPLSSHRFRKATVQRADKTNGFN